MDNGMTRFYFISGRHFYFFQYSLGAFAPPPAMPLCWSRLCIWMLHAKDLKSLRRFFYEPLKILQKISESHGNVRRKDC